MRRMRGVGVAGAVVLAAGVLVGCSGSGSGGDGKAPAVESKRAEEPAAAPEETEPSYPATPEGDLDKQADQVGWTFDDSLYSSVAEFVQDICDSLPVSAKATASRPQWLAGSGNLDGDGKPELEAGIPKLCPSWTKTLKAAVSGHYDRWLTDGTYDVKVHPGKPDPSADKAEIVAGTYRTQGDLKGCYWERTSQGGSIIANQMATAASQVTVTVRAGELFTVRECGTWKPVG
ncbi:hypothetical protein ACIPW9_36185 [Streptomyces sp. NPDC090052]|uniref:hypothetical protein n=1 Tax=Streptomyces sp. NPDC090052 TaxID=3365931 RepID=UPI00382FAE1F